VQHRVTNTDISQTVANDDSPLKIWFYVIFNVAQAETKRSVRILVCKSFLSAGQ